MLWVWLSLALSAVGRFFIPPPPESRKAPINPNAICPSCGNKDGELRYKVMAAGNGFKGGPMVRHTCHVCRFGWYDQVFSIAKYPAEEE